MVHLLTLLQNCKIHTKYRNTESEQPLFDDVCNENIIGFSRLTDINRNTEFEQPLFDGLCNENNIGSSKSQLI